MKYLTFKEFSKSYTKTNLKARDFFGLNLKIMVLLLNKHPSLKNLPPSFKFIFVLFHTQPEKVILALILHLISKLF